MLHFLYVKQLEVSILKFYEKNNALEHIMALLPLWVLLILATYLIPHKNIPIMLGLMLLYVALIVHFILQLNKLERIVITDETIRKYRGLKVVQSVDISDVAYILARTAYRPVQSSTSSMLRRVRVIDICTKNRAYVRIPLDIYDIDYIEELVLTLLRADKSTRIYVSYGTHN